MVIVFGAMISLEVEMELSLLILLAAIVLAALLVPWFEGLIKNGGALIIAAAVVCIAFLLRVSVLQCQTGDYNDFLSQWVQFFRNYGGFSALSNSTNGGAINYNVPYLYFLAIFSRLPMRDLYLIKLLSIAFDVVLAYGIMKLVSVFTDSNAKRLSAYLVTLLLPTVILNSAQWGQCDSIYTSFLVLSLYHILTGSPRRSMAEAAIALGFKLQAVFLLPVFLVMLFAKKLRWRDVLVFPLTYLLLLLPAVFCGADFMSLLTFYFHSTGTIGSGLNYNSPSLFTFVSGGEDVQTWSAMGIAAAGLYVLALWAWSWVRRKSLSNEALLGLSILFAVGIPLLLPHMHDRYFFLSDVLTVVPAVLWLSYIPAAALASIASLLCYSIYLRGSSPLPLRFGSLALLAVLLIFFAFTAERMGSARLPKGSAEKKLEN